MMHRHGKTELRTSTLHAVLSCIYALFVATSCTGNAAAEPVAAQSEPEAQTTRAAPILPVLDEFERRNPRIYCHRICWRYA